MKKKAETTYENHLDDTEPKWFAVYTRYKREKIVCSDLNKKGIECYLPINRVVRRWARKVKKVELPLISCYVFVKITKKEYVSVLETENVVSFISFSRNLISIPNEEIDLLKRITGEFGELEMIPNSEEIAEGDVVEIVRGNLTGLQGQLIEKESQKKFIVQLDHLGYQLLMEVSPELLRRVD